MRIQRSSAAVAGLILIAAPWWHQRDFKGRTINPGVTLHWSTNRQCSNNNTQTWHAENAISSAYVALSPDVNLACSV